MNQNAEQIWREFRWSENAFRYHSDLLLGLMEKLKSEKQSSASRSNGPVPVGNTAEGTNRPGPGPCELPPYPCKLSIDQATESLQNLGEWVEVVIQQSRDLLDEARRQGITEIRFRPSQLPFVQEGASPKIPGATETPPLR